MRVKQITLLKLNNHFTSRLSKKSSTNISKKEEEKKENSL